MRYSADIVVIDLEASCPAEDEGNNAAERSNIIEIGAGGGSIAHVDRGGALRVGPNSAGADPGPACYGQGNLPTVTDANLVLGRLVPEFFLGGIMKIYPERSRTAIGRTISSNASSCLFSAKSLPMRSRS